MPDRPPGRKRTAPGTDSQGRTRKHSTGTAKLPATVTGGAVGRVREALEEHGCQPRGSNIRFRARCPVHGSRGPTLAVTQGPGRVLVKCHAQCETADVLAAIGLTWRDLYDEPYERKAWIPRPRESRLERAYRIAEQAAKAAPPGLRLSPEERIRRAEHGCREDADAHWWRTLARYAALAHDEACVRRAYRDWAAWLAWKGPPSHPGKPPKPSHEQFIVLATRAEDLRRQR